MLMEGRLKFFTTQNSAGVSQEKDIAVISQTIKVNGDQVSNVKPNQTKQNKHNKSIKCLHTPHLK